METKKYFVVVEISVFDEMIKHTPIGYVLDLDDANTIKSIHYEDYKEWIEVNKVSLESGKVLITDYQDYPVYEIGWVTTSIGDLYIDEITDFVNLT